MANPLMAQWRTHRLVCPLHVHNRLALGAIHGYQSSGDEAGPLRPQKDYHVREPGREREFYMDVAMEYWERGADLESIYTLRRLAIKAQLDWRPMWLKLESGHYRSWVMEEHRAAVDRGVKGVPSYLIGEQLYAGDVSLEELRSAIRG